MEIKKQRLEKMERHICQGSVMESDSPEMSAPAATALPAGFSKRASDILWGEIDLPSLKKKKQKGSKDSSQTPRT
jgi:hypothetical protein